MAKKTEVKLDSLPKNGAIDCVFHLNNKPCELEIGETISPGGILINISRWDWADNARRRVDPTSRVKTTIMVRMQYKDLAHLINILQEKQNKTEKKKNK